MIALVAIGVVIVVVAVFVVIKVTGGSSKPTASTDSSTRSLVSASLYDKYTNVSVATLAAAAKHYAGDSVAYPTVTDDPPITKTGKPEALFVGAEYCPYCATERWPLILALSKFGTFTGLTEIRSSSSDIYASTPTWSFYKAHYTSPYLKLVTVEEYTSDEHPLQTLTKSETALVDKYAEDGIPFVYLNGKAIINARAFNPQLLRGSAGEHTPTKTTFTEDLKSVSSGTTTLADNVYKAAGVIISNLCRMTGGKPADVCKLFPKPITS